MNLKERILAIAIAILFVIFVYYGIQTFYHEPDYSDYCNSTLYSKPYYADNARPYNYTLCQSIEKANQPVEMQCNNAQGMMQYETDGNGCQVATTCDYCNRDYNQHTEKYNRVVFIISGIIGILAIVIGAIILSLESVGSGIMGGGVLTLIYGTLRYWGNLADVGRFIVIGLALAILIWLGYKKLHSLENAAKNPKPKKSGRKR